MRVLLDTHSFLWFIMGSGRLSSEARTMIADVDNVRLLSSVSLWEIAIKASRGRLQLSQPFEVLIPEQLSINDIQVLPIQVDHLAALVSLPFHGLVPTRCATRPHP